MFQKIDILRELNYLVRALNKTVKSPREEIFSVCKKIIRKLTDYFFMIIDLGTTSFGNGSLFNEPNGNSPLIKHYWPMYIDFDEYPRYSGRTSVIFEKKVNESIQSDHGYAYSSGKMFDQFK